MAAKIPKTNTSSVAGIEKIRELGGITEYRLKSNGLQILLAPDASVPVVGSMVTYHVGSRNEAIGYTGATHLLEHLLFKGSTNFNKEKGGTIWELLESKGAMLNATTWFDRTNYYEVTTPENIEIAIQIEADRMRNAFILEEDRKSEMPIVRNEFERGENSSYEALDKLIWAQAYQAHPYHHSTIGWPSDFEKVSIERLQQFYNDFYWPDNATVTIAGNFDEKKMLTILKKYFGVHAKNPKPYPLMYTEEPPQEGERRGIVSRAGVNMVCVAHKTPAANHADLPALFVLTFILSGRKTSRLYQSLVETSMATSVDSTVLALQDPALLQTFVTLADGKKHADLEGIVKKEYDVLKKELISTEELKQAKISSRVGAAKSRDGVYALLSAINEDIATGDWTHFVRDRVEVEKVTVQDIRRVAKTYLTDDQSTIGWFVNTSET